MRGSRNASARIGLFATFALCVLALIYPGASRAQEKKPKAVADQPQTDEIVDTFNTALALLTVTVTDAQGHPVVNLKHDAFTVFDDKAPQKIDIFTNEDQPASIGILLDTSGSMRDTGMVSILRDNLLHFIQLGHSANQYFLLGFSDSVQLLTDWTSDRNALVDGLNKITRIKGASALFDALHTGIEKVEQGKHAKHVLLLISDGMDNGSTHKLGETIRRLKELGVIVYTLGIRSSTTDPLAQYGPNLLAEFASITGGVVYFPPGVKETDAAFGRIAMEVRHQYMIGYYPTNMKRDGKWHNVKVEVKPVEAKNEAQPDAPPRTITLKTRTRAGYYARRD